MNFKILFLIIVIINLLIKVVFDILKIESAMKNIPDSLKFIESEKEYPKWKKYLKEKSYFSLIHDIITSLPLLFLIGFDVFPFLTASFNNWIINLIIILGSYSLINFLISLPFHIFDTYVIQENYGFNNTKIPTFIADELSSLIIEFSLSFFMALIFFGIYKNLPGWATIILNSLIFILFIFLLRFLFPYLAKIFNKFTPIEEGELKSKLLNLMEKNDFKIKGIFIVNESKRSTKENAYFAGSGKSRRIVIYDNLIANHSADEIVAVFAHELGHAKCKHSLKSLPLSFVGLFICVLILYLSTLFKNLSIDLGFQDQNFAIIFLFAGEVIELFNVFFGIINNYFSRKHECEADAFAAKNGYSEFLKLSLINLTRKNYGFIYVNPFLEFMTLSHPSLSKRIINLDNYSK